MQTYTVHVCIARWVGEWVGVVNQVHNHACTEMVAYNVIAT